MPSPPSLPSSLPLSLPHLLLSRRGPAQGTRCRPSSDPLRSGPTSPILLPSPVSVSVISRSPPPPAKTGRAARQQPIRDAPCPLPLTSTHELVWTSLSQLSEKSSDTATGDMRPEGDVSDQNGRDGMPSLQQEEAVIKKKYGGIMPRKTPLISKDHDRAYFDSADWALGKQGGNPQKPKGPLEALRPKLQPTQQQTRSRRFLGESADNEENVHSPTEDVSSPREDASQNQNQTEGKDKE